MLDITFAISSLFIQHILIPPYVSGNNLILGVNCEGLLMIKPDDKFVLNEYRYQDIESIFLDPSDSFITINLMKLMPESQNKCFVFETPHKAEIGSLIASYCPALAGWIGEAEAPARKVSHLSQSACQVFQVREYRVLFELIQHVLAI